MHAPTDRVVVTGGAGFIGSHLVDSLLADGSQDVVVLDNLSRCGPAHLSAHTAHPHLRVVHGDVRDARVVDEVMRGARIVFHLAATSVWSPGCDQSPEDLFETNVAGTFNVLRAAARNNVSRLLFASSWDVYGPPIDLPVPEDAPLLPSTLHGASKAAGEAFCRAFRREHDLDAVILRFSNVYGPRDNGGVIPPMLHSAAAGQALDVYGGKHVADFLWVDYAVQALRRAAAVERTLPPTNVAGGTGTRIMDVARRIAQLVNRPGNIKLLPAGSADGLRFIASVDRMRQLLSVDPPLDPFSYLPSLLATPAFATA